ncbi:hypothetical protein Syun_022204 [Stephania yunnanensis]|uniref:Uncharacterized protein n=1 Tax=Stephania yunnanensis TaxID=152371 RepID=A0AAP0IHE7_9MAGN
MRVQICEISRFYVFALLVLCCIFGGVCGDRKIITSGEELNLGGTWATGLMEFAEAPGPGGGGEGGFDALVLAANRTDRPDVLRGFKHYHGGWNITDRHYWASVGFTGSSGFILAILWFISFGLALLFHHCCNWGIKIKDIGSKHSLQISLTLLLIFTCAAVAGCILLSVGQDNFHGEVLHTMKYLVNQSDYTVQILRNVTGYLSLAKSINVDQVFLPQNVKDEIDKLNVDLDTAANTLTEKTSENSQKIRKVFNAVRTILIVIAAVMIFVALLGLLLSILAHRHAIYIFILSGWLLVAFTFILCGVFLIFNNAIADTRVAMGEWADHPHAETALSSILACVDKRTTNKTLIQSREVINQLVNVINTVIWTFANTNPPPQLTPYYYNQTGPLMPPLCSPFDSELHFRSCGPQEVTFGNASWVWQKYTCEVSPSGLCITEGRITPEMYSQLVAAVDVSYGLDHYTVPLLSLQNCDFARETFSTIASDYCPPLERDLRTVVAGLGLISVGVMLCLLLWILYANRPQRESVFVNQSSEMKQNEDSRSNKNRISNASSSPGAIV